MRNLSSLFVTTSAPIQRRVYRQVRKKELVHQKNSALVIGNSIYILRKRNQEKWFDDLRGQLDHYDTMTFSHSLIICVGNDLKLHSPFFHFEWFTVAFLSILVGYIERLLHEAAGKLNPFI